VQVTLRSWIIGLAAMATVPVVSTVATSAGDIPEKAPEQQVDPFEAFKKTLKSDGKFYNWNGYWQSEADLRDNWATRKGGKGSRAFDGSRSTESDAGSGTVLNPDVSLNVNMIEGRLDYWADPEDRKLTYAIDKSSMTDEQYRIVQAAMAEAAKDWEDACPQCGIYFDYKHKFDAKPDHKDVRLIVRLEQGEFGLGRSFFPSSPVEERVMTVSPAFFGADVARAGVLRHQLGHVLGYRHEHITPEAGPGCFAEDNSFVTGSYDPKSVMHYPCGNGGTKEMRLSPRDIVSHQIIYGQATIQVTLEGDDILGKAARVMQSLASRYPRFAMRPFDLSSDEGCQTYVKALGLEPALSPQPDHPMPATVETCQRFKPLRKAGADQTEMYPVVFFESGTDVASGSVLHSDQKAAREYQALLERVRPDTKEIENDGKIGFSYFLEWRRYRANIPVSKAEVRRVWTGLDPLLTANSGITLNIDNSVATSISEQKKIGTYSVGNMFADTDKICLPNTEVTAPYAQISETDLEFDPDSINAGLPKLKCDFPEPETCNECSGAGACGDETKPQCDHCSVCNKGKADAIIVDTSLDPSALKRPPMSIAPDAAAPPAQCVWQKFDAPKHHGTLMAQIVAGGNKFVGFVPEVTPALIENNAQASNLENRVKQLVKEMKSAVVVVPTQFCYPKTPFSNLVGSPPAELCEIPGETRADVSDNARFTLINSHWATKRIKENSKWLWVASIGQSKTAANAAPPSISIYSKESIATPIVFAEEGNVLVVSACETCKLSRDAKSADRRVWQRANQGIDRYRPHVIAPGGIDKTIELDGQFTGGIPGYGRSGEPVKAFGTSQSAAFVGGLASKMVACYPRSYSNFKVKLKEALQFTSMPVPPSQSFGDQVQTGLVDVGMALRNPGYAYIMKAGATTDKDIKRVEPSTLGWCTSELKFKTEKEKVFDIPTESIRRIVKLRSGAAARWIVYQRQSVGAIERSEEFTEAVPADTPILSVGDERLTLEELKDALLFDAAGTTACSGTP
jgi:hypothetical protein